MIDPTLIIITGDQADLAAHHLADWIDGIAQVWLPAGELRAELERPATTGLRLVRSAPAELDSLADAVLLAAARRRVLVIYSISTRRTMRSLPHWLSRVAPDGDDEPDLHLVIVLGRDQDLPLVRGSRALPIQADHESSSSTWIRRYEQARSTILGPSAGPMGRRALVSIDDLDCTIQIGEVAAPGLYNPDADMDACRRSAGRRLPA